MPPSFRVGRVLPPLAFVGVMLLIRLAYIVTFFGKRSYHDWPVVTVIPGMAAGIMMRNLRAEQKPNVAGAVLTLIVALVFSLLFVYVTALIVISRIDPGITLTSNVWVVLLEYLLLVRLADLLFVLMGLIVSMVLYWHHGYIRFFVVSHEPREKF